MKIHFILSDLWSLMRGNRHQQMLLELKEKASINSNLDMSNWKVQILSDLSFYPGTHLIRLRELNVTEPSVVPYWLRLANGDWLRLDGRWEVIETINAMCSIKLNEDNCLDYLDFISFFLRQDNNFAMVLNYSYCLFSGMNPDQLARWLGDYISPRLISGLSDLEKLTYDVARVQQDGKLELVRFQIQLSNGLVEKLSTEDTPMNVPMMPSGVLTAALLEAEASSGADNEKIDAMTKSLENTCHSGKIDKQSRPAAKVLTSITPADNESDEAMVKTFRKLLEPVPLQTVPCDLKTFSENLNQRYPWCKVVTEYLLKSLIVSAHSRGIVQLPPLLLVGSPGTGKTSYVTYLAKALELPFQIINVAGKSDPRDLLGTSRGYGTRQPGLILRLILQHWMANGLCVLDELDKEGTGNQNGTVADALLTFLEPSSACAVWDECLGGSANLSYWNWFATANSVRPIPSPLLSRFTVIEVPKPERAHYPAIVNNTVVDFASKHRIHPDSMPVFDAADWRWLEQHAYQDPRKCRRATELLLSHWLAHPKPSMYLH